MVENTADGSRGFVVGQKVRVLTGRLGTVDMIDQWPSGHLRYRVRLDGETYGPGKPAPTYYADELAPVRTDDTVPATDEEVVEYMTSSTVAANRDARGVEEYECPVNGCDFHILAAGPLDPDEPDHFAESVEDHQRSHEAETDPRDALRDIVGEVSLLDVWQAVGPHMKLVDGLDIRADRRSFAAALRAVADVLDGGAR